MPIAGLIRCGCKPLLHFTKPMMPNSLPRRLLFITSEHYYQYFNQLDFLTLQGITAASVYKRFHSMCNGANLAYERSAFYEVNGFNNIDNIASGDDMLLMHKIFKQYPDKVFYLKNRHAIVTTEPSYTPGNNFFTSVFAGPAKPTVTMTNASL